MNKIVAAVNFYDRVQKFFVVDKLRGFCFRTRIHKLHDYRRIIFRYELAYFERREFVRHILCKFKQLRQIFQVPIHCIKIFRFNLFKLFGGIINQRAKFRLLFGSKPYAKTAVNLFMNDAGAIIYYVRK